MKTATTFFVALLLLVSVTTSLAQEIVIELTPAPGSGMLTYPGEIPVTSVQYSYVNKATIGSATSGAGGGKVEFEPFVLTKPVDGASLALQRNLWAGAHYQYVRVSFYRKGASGARELAYRVVLGTVFTTNYAASGAGGCTNCPAVSETVTFAYGQVATYDPATDKVVGWSQLTNTANYNIPDSVIKQ